MFKTPWAKPQSVVWRGLPEKRIEVKDIRSGVRAAVLLTHNSALAGLHDRVSLYGDSEVSLNLHV
jgi:hypothetical protein